MSIMYDEEDELECIPGTGLPHARTWRCADPTNSQHNCQHHYTFNSGQNHVQFIMDTVREQNIRSAIDAVANGATVRDAAKLHGIPKSTLSDRLHGSTSKSASKLEARKLSPAQEISVADWCLDQEAAGRAPTKAEITRRAQEVLAQANDHTPLGHRWADRFLRRHQRVKPRTTLRLEKSQNRNPTKTSKRCVCQNRGDGQSRDGQPATPMAKEEEPQHPSS